MVKDGDDKGDNDKRSKYSDYLFKRARRALSI
jgi:hypothetical protein